MSREINTEDDYRSKLLKLIPSEVIGAYTVLQGIVPTGTTATERAMTAWALTAIVGILIAVTPLFLSRVHKVAFKPQIAVTVVSFVIWVYSLGGPFQAWGTYTGLEIFKPWAASAVLVLWTTIVPILIGPTTADGAANTGSREPA